MKNENKEYHLSDGDEAMCAYFVENPYALCRVVQLMPHGNPTLDFLEKLYSYAKTRNRKVDLANALLGYDGKSGALPQMSVGRDWFRECTLPGACPEFFLQVEKYSWTRMEIESPEFNENELDEVEALLEWIEDVKKAIGDGIVDMENTLTKIRLRRNSIIKALRSESGKD